MKRIWMMLMCLMLSAALLCTGGTAEEEEEFFQPVEPDETQAVLEPGETPQPEATEAPVLQPDGSVIVTLTAVGDVTIGRNVQHSGSSIFEKELKKQNDDVNFIFRNVKDIFEGDDVTIVNFEGVLADTYTVPSNKRNNEFLFLGKPGYARALTENSVEMATIENNHINDFGEQGVTDTISALEGAGVAWANADHMAVYQTQGLRIGLLAYQTLNQPFTSDELKVMVDEDITAARKTCDLVVVYFHWGNELDYSPRDNQVMLGRAAIDSGADLVLGAHSHRINPIECYQGRYIVYSLANCSFAGNNKPKDMYTFIFQTRFKMRDGALVQNTFRIIPCRISSRKDYNDFAITPLTEQTNIDTVIKTLKSSGKNLDYAVESYPLEWE